jgi:hypothetical protein
MQYDSNGNLNMRQRSGGSFTNSVSVAFNATNHLYWRIRVGSTCYFDTSPDNSTWTNQHSFAPGFAVTALKPFLLLNYGTLAAVGNAGALDDFTTDVGADGIGAGYGLNWSQGVQKFILTPLGCIPVQDTDPSGAPPDTPANHTRAVFNHTNNKLWVWNDATSAWKAITLT